MGIYCCIRSPVNEDKSVVYLLPRGGGRTCMATTTLQRAGTPEEADPDHWKEHM